MGLIICPDCGKSISDRATACIGCGAPVLTTGENITAPAPTSVSYDKNQKAFHGTLAMLIKLTMKTIHDLKWKVETVNENVGLVSFQTGMTWGSFSGVSGSISIEEQSTNFFQMSATGKQNLAAGQLVALNIGNEAQKKGAAVITRMTELVPPYFDPDKKPLMSIEELEQKLSAKRNG
jgi:hypothetical protein